MQTLQFVNVSGDEPWKNKDAKKCVRSHAMKDFRRRQREGTSKTKRKPGEATFILNNKRISRTTAPTKVIRPSHSSEVVSLRTNSPPTSSARSSFADVFELRLNTRNPLLAHIDSPSARQISSQDAIFSLPSPSPSVSSSTSEDSISRPFKTDFDLNMSQAVFSVLDGVNGRFEKIVGLYFHSTHSWLTVIWKKRFIKRVAASRMKAEAEVAVLLLAMRLVAEPFDVAKVHGDASRDELYLATKNLHSLVFASKGPSMELVQAGLIIALFEHNSAIRDIAYITLQQCSHMSRFLGLDLTIKAPESRDYQVSALDEERRRTYWGIVALDRLVTLHDEKHERPLIMPDPLLSDPLPAVRDEYWENASSGNPVSGCSHTVASAVPRDSDSFCRQIQSCRLMGIVQDCIRQRYEDNPSTVRARVYHVDRLLQEGLGKLLSDCDGGCTQYCGPISLIVAGSFLLHDYQLRSTMTSSDPEDVQAAARSKLSIERMVSIMVDIIRAFPLSHLPELSPSALYCPYLAAMHSLQLDRINGVRSQPTLGGNDLLLLINCLKHFSVMWNCTVEYVKDIERGQARALPLPLSPTT